MLDDEETPADLKPKLNHVCSQPAPYLLRLNYAVMVGKGRRGIIIRRLSSFVSLLVAI